MIKTPWTDEQVANLNRWQAAGYVHEFTCPNHHDGSRVLIAKTDGWHCPSCDYKQDWAPDTVALDGPPPNPFDRRIVQKFAVGQLVYKWTGDYQGPGRVRGIAGLENGKLRYLVGHRIEGGTGEFLHVYAEGNLREAVDDNDVGG